MNPDHSTIKEYSNIIRRLAKSGRSGYNHYLIKPLTTWAQRDEKDLEKYLSMLHIEKRKQNTFAISPLYKKAISRAVAPDQFDLSRVGTLCLEFLKEMGREDYILSSQEAKEFFEILSEPFKIYREVEFEKTSRSFTDEMMTASPSDVAEIIKKTSPRDSELEKVSETLLNEIIDDVLNGGSRYESLSVKYLVKIATPQSPVMHRKLESSLKDIGVSDEKITDLMKNTAIIIYHEIIKSIRTGDLKRAVALISKYAVLFRGNPGTPYHHEVDNFEKNLFNVIEKKNLWDSMN